MLCDAFTPTAALSPSAYWHKNARHSPALDAGWVGEIGIFGREWVLIDGYLRGDAMVWELCEDVLCLDKFRKFSREIFSYFALFTCTVLNKIFRI